MRVKRLILKNWRNFTEADIVFKDRMFFVGPNASGKSNLLDVFKFLKDISKDGGGLSKALSSRGGYSKVRCLHARKNPNIYIEIHLENNSDLWKYVIEIKYDTRHIQGPIIETEDVFFNDNNILHRPNEQDKADRKLLTQTHLEQILANKEFRKINEFFTSFNYLHLIPQFIRFTNAFNGEKIPDDPYGQMFLLRVNTENKATRDSRLKKISAILHNAIPNIINIKSDKDEYGNPHLEAEFKNWRNTGAKQREDQFSDGTLRLIGLLWSILESKSLLLLEEPELSLHDAINEKLPSLINRINMTKKSDRRSQIFISTHNSAILNDESIGSDEIILLKPSLEGTKINNADQIEVIRTLMESGVRASDAVIPQTKPQNVDQISIDF